MKKLFILFILITASVSAQEINWMSMKDALAAQKKNPKKIFMDVYTNWCGPCKLLDKKTFHNTDVVNYVNKHFYAVKFNAEGNEEFEYQGHTFTNPGYKEGRRGRNSSHVFANSLKIAGYPSMVFFDEESNIIFPITGYYKALELEVFLKVVGSDDYKKITSQNQFTEYQKNFKGTFKG